MTRPFLLDNDEDIIDVLPESKEMVSAKQFLPENVVSEINEDLNDARNTLRGLTRISTDLAKTAVDSATQLLGDDKSTIAASHAIKAAVEAVRTLIDLQEKRSKLQGNNIPDKIVNNNTLVITPADMLKLLKEKGVV